MESSAEFLCDGSLPDRLKFAGEARGFIAAAIASSEDVTEFVILPSPGDSALRGNIDAGGEAIRQATACSKAGFGCFFVLLGLFTDAYLSFLDSPVMESSAEFLCDGSLPDRLKFAGEARGFGATMEEVRRISSTSTCLSMPRLTCSMFGAGSLQRKARVLGTRCYAATNNRAPPPPNWEHLARISLLCALLHRAGYFKVPPPTQSRQEAPPPNQSALKELKSDRIVKIWHRVTLLSLLIQCLLIGYYAAAGDNQKLRVLVNAAEKAMKCYKIVEEINKILK